MAVKVCEDVNVSKSVFETVSVGRNDGKNEGVNDGATGGDYDGLPVVEVHAIQSPCSLECSILVNGRPVRALIDTGAMVTLISTPVAITLGGIALTGESVCLRGISGGDMVGSKVENLHVQMGNRMLEASAFMADIREEFIIGLDFLRKHNVNINMADGVLKLHDEAGGQAQATFIEPKSSVETQTVDHAIIDGEPLQRLDVHRCVQVCDMSIDPWREEPMDKEEVLLRDNVEVLGVDDDCVCGEEVAM